MNTPESISRRRDCHRMVITVLHVKRCEPIAQATGGLLGVVVAGGIAAWTGSAGAMGTPLLAVAVLVAVWAFRRSTAQLVHSSPT
ncbi:MAG: hypothetical protein WBQ44_14285 [Rhodococcus sp. (in: high G+C Gram-positive bacteria)]